MSRQPATTFTSITPWMAMTVAPARLVDARGPLERMLALFADVRTGEAGTALLLMLNVFLLMTSYSIIKPVRDALVLPLPHGAEISSYASAGMVFVLLFFIPAYSAVASRVSRIRLISLVSLFFIACLVGFYGLAKVHAPLLPIAFFIWIGIFNVSIIQQFWSFANDIYTPADGKRLFAIIAFGQTLGAILGAAVAKTLIKPFGVDQLLLVSAVILGACMLIAHAIDGRERPAITTRNHAVMDTEPLRPGGAFKLVMSNRYLLYLALLMLVLNFVNTNGQYILSKTLKAVAEQSIPAGLDKAAQGEFVKRFAGDFVAGFQLWVNIITAFVQLFVVSRILKWFGVRVALFVLPLIALGGYTLLAVAPVLGLIRGVKIAENATDYSLQNTSRQALFLPTSREAKYKAKAAIDTFFVRGGDVLSAVLVLIGTQFLRLSPAQFSAVNVALVLVWIVVVSLIAREHAKFTGIG